MIVARKTPGHKRYKVIRDYKINNIAASKLLQVEVERLFGKNSRIERKIRRKNHIVLDNYDNTLRIFIDPDYESDNPDVDVNDFLIELTYQINKDDISFQYQGGNDLHYLEALEKTQYFPQIDEIASQNTFKVTLKEFKSVLKVLAEEFLFFANYAEELNLYVPEIDTRDEYQEWKEEQCHA